MSCVIIIANINNIYSFTVKCKCNSLFFFTMDKRKVFDIFKFRKVIKKDDFPLTNNVDTQEQNDQLVDDPDSCSTKTETIQVQDKPSDKPFSHASSSTFANSLDTDLGDMDSGPIRPMLKVSQ